MVATGVALFSGGSWHDFSKFERYAARWVDESGHGRLRSFAPGALSGVAELGCATALLYTCFDEHTALDHRERDLEALEAWVEQGGRLVSLHATAVAANRHPRLARLLGGRFVSHPPKALFVAEIPDNDHFLGRRISSFEIEDERYELEVAPEVRVHLTTRAEDRLLPLVWSRDQGHGKAVYIALGHDESSWALPAFETLMWLALDFPM